MLSHYDMDKIAATALSGSHSMSSSAKDVREASQINNGSQNTTVTASVPKNNINPSRSMSVDRAIGSTKQSSRFSKTMMTAASKPTTIRSGSMSIKL